MNCSLVSVYRKGWNVGSGYWRQHMFICIGRSGGPCLGMTDKSEDVCSMDPHPPFLRLPRVDTGLMEGWWMNGWSKSSGLRRLVQISGVLNTVGPLLEKRFCRTFKGAKFQRHHLHVVTHLLRTSGRKDFTKPLLQRSPLHVTHLAQRA